MIALNAQATQTAFWLLVPCSATPLASMSSELAQLFPNFAVYGFVPPPWFVKP